MSARDDILAAVGVSAVGGTAPSTDEIERESAALLARVAALRPPRMTAAAAEVFRTRVTAPAVGATVCDVDSLAQVPAAVHTYLAERNLPARIALQPHPRLLELDWSGINTHRDIAVDEAASVCIAPYAVAETGSLALRSGPDMPVLFAFLPLHHIVVLEARNIVPWLEDCAALEARQPAPHKLILVTGPSGTTDIEGTLVRGAHGPAHLHIVLVDSLDHQSPLNHQS